MKCEVKKDGSWPRVAVVVVNWNRPDDTAECLSSLAALDYPDLFTILVDNGSTDGSVERLRSLFPECTYISNTRNLGFAEGNNVGIRHALSAGADYVLLLNNDATIDRDTLTLLVQVAQSDPSIGIVGPKIYLADRPRVIWFGGGKVDEKLGLPIHLGWMQEDTGEEESIADVDYICGCALLAKAELFPRLGLLDSDYFLLFEDTDFCARARDGGYRVVLVPQASVYHKASSSFGGDASPQYLYYFHRNNLIYVKKNMRGPGRWRVYLEVLRRQWKFVRGLHRKGGPQTSLRRRAVERAVADFVLGRWGERK